MRSALIAIVSLPSFALGQPQGEGTWIWEVQTQDGDAIVEPGETATVSLWLDMDLSVGEQLPDGYIMSGFGAGVVSVIGGDNADQGQILGWEPNPVLDQFGLEGTTDGVSIFDVQLGQRFEKFDASDPIFLMSFQWEPQEFGSYEAAYSLLIEEWLFNLPGFLIWKSEGNESITEHWPVIPADVTIGVVPAPAPIAPLAVAFLCVSRRNRRMDDAPRQALDDGTYSIGLVSLPPDTGGRAASGTSHGSAHEAVISAHRSR